MLELARPNFELGNLPHFVSDSFQHFVFDTAHSVLGKRWHFEWDSHSYSLLGISLQIRTPVALPLLRILLLGDVADHDVESEEPQRILDFLFRGIE